MNNRYGVIDIGSNAIKCFVGTIVYQNNQPRVIREMYARIPVRLGEDVFSWGEILPLTEKKMTKGIVAFSQLISIWEPKRSLIVATSAMRDAKNGKELLNSLIDKTGIEGKIISGKEEAEFVLNLLQWFYERKTQKIIFDLGGGSLEINFINADGKIESDSFKVGAVRLLKNTVNPSEIKNMYYFIEKHLHLDNFIAMATGGNVDALKSFFGKKGDDRLYLEEISDAFKKLAPLSKEERIEQFFLPPDRADVILPAAHLFMTIMKKFNIPYLYVPKVGLADAVALAMDEKKI
jgi:exopolyphosphatase/guanosine-5'-triphosphate,3'-diphosphate pyrophosphatase